MPGIEARFGEAEQEAQHVELRRRLDEHEARREEAPGDHDPRDPDARADLVQQHVARQLEQEIAEEEDAGAEAEHGLAEARGPATSAASRSRRSRGRGRRPRSKASGTARCARTPWRRCVSFLRRPAACWRIRACRPAALGQGSFTRLLEGMSYGVLLPARVERRAQILDGRFFERLGARRGHEPQPRGFFQLFKRVGRL